MESLLDLTGKVAVITGGSRGIGKSIAEAYAAHGADVVIASRKLDNCKAVADDIAAKTGRRTLAVGTHVGRWDECNQLADTVLETFGRCDILVNNAGMSPLYEKVTDITEEYYDKVSSVNLKGPFALSLRLGGHMFDNGMIMRAVGERMIIAPPLVMTKAQIDEMVALIRRCLDLTLADAQRQGWLA